MSNEFIVKFRPFDKFKRCFDIVAVFGNNVRPNRNEFNMINLFRFCRKDEISFDIVAETGNTVAIKGNNVEATFDL